MFAASSRYVDENDDHEEIEEDEGEEHRDEISEKEREIAARYERDTQEAFERSRRTFLDVVDENLNPEQVKAIKNAIKKPFSIIHGMPGTGKTTTIQTLVKCWKYVHLSSDVVIMLLAPTGKATQLLQKLDFGGYANREDGTIDESVRGTPVSCMTVDMMLSSTSFHKKGSYVLIDEASMLTCTKFGKILDALEPARVVLVGDPDQLDPIETPPGEETFFETLCLHSDVIPNVKLTKTYRFANVNAALMHNITDFNTISTCEDLKVDGATFTVLQDAESWESIEAQIRSVCHTIRDSKMKETYQFICRTNELRTKLNAAVQEVMSYGYSDSTEIGIRLNDPVICLSNHYVNKRLKVANGTIGRMCWTPARGFHVMYENGFKDYEMDTQFELAYAITTHKSQGDQYDNVLFVLEPSDDRRGGERKAVYTVMSRAKKRCIVIGIPERLNKLLERSARKRRSDFAGYFDEALESYVPPPPAPEPTVEEEEEVHTTERAHAPRKKIRRTRPHVDAPSNTTDEPEHRTDSPGDGDDDADAHVTTAPTFAPRKAVDFYNDYD